MHTVRIDRINRLIEQRVSGTLDLDEVEASGNAVRQAVRSLGAGPGAHVTLFDLSEMTLASDAVIASAMRQFADPRYTCVKARKVAMVIPSAVARLKLGPSVASRDNMAVFAGRDEALRWLFDRAPAGTA